MVDNPPQRNGRYGYEGVEEVAEEYSVNAAAALGMKVASTGPSPPWVASLPILGVPNEN